MVNVIIAPQLFDFLDRLEAPDQVQVNRFIKTFCKDPAHPGLRLERVGRARSANVWSGRASTKLRVILFKDADTWAILFADRHDAAYEWARRREIGRHTITGSLQIVESVETVREVERAVEISRKAGAVPTFGAHGDEYLVSLGVPASWLPAHPAISR